MRYWAEIGILKGTVWLDIHKLIDVERIEEEKLFCLLYNLMMAKKSRIRSTRCI